MFVTFTSTVICIRMSIQKKYNILISSNLNLKKKYTGAPKKKSSCLAPYFERK